uniref:Uncharacterized protein n=1 Tax=viral metagenome TaxID=1070528 RepID=A0A6C0C6M5_9ZZZZ
MLLARDYVARRFEYAILDYSMLPARDCIAKRFGYANIRSFNVIVVDYHIKI